ncbi:MAG: GIY-YIG nuclease family protein [Calditrichaeota bacterium]|nr:GIY-YIG nuclease family protein [Calditrichota bacterium]
MSPTKENTFYVYVLELENGKKYIGQTNNLQRRIHEHQKGLSPYTKKFKFKKLLYYEIFSSRAAAMKREKFLKSGQGRQWLKRKLAEQAIIDK